MNGLKTLHCGTRQSNQQNEVINLNDETVLPARKFQEDIEVAEIEFNL